MDERKQCPYCGELIAAKAVKCRFCGEWLEEQRPQPSPAAIEETVEIIETETPLGTTVTEIIETTVESADTAGETQGQSVPPATPPLPSDAYSTQPPTPPVPPVPPIPPVPEPPVYDYSDAAQPTDGFTDVPPAAPLDSDYGLYQEEQAESWLMAYLVRPFVFKYFKFGGRDTRRQFWMSLLMVNITAMGLGGLFLLLTVLAGLSGFIVGLSLLALFSLYTIVPSLAMTVRRLRDAGQSWAHIFWPLLPFIGNIILIVILCKPTYTDPFLNTTTAERPRRATAFKWFDGLYITSCIVVNVVAFVMAINVVQQKINYYSNFYNLITDLATFGPDIADFLSGDNSSAEFEMYWSDYDAGDYDSDYYYDSDDMEEYVEEQPDYVENPEMWINQAVNYLDSHGVLDNRDLAENPVYQQLWNDMNRFDMYSLYSSYDALASSVVFERIKKIAEDCIVNGWQPADFAVNGQWNNGDSNDHTITTADYINWIRKKCDD